MLTRTPPLGAGGAARRIAPLMLLAAATVGAPGCGGPAGRNAEERHLPSTEEARDALRTALEAWRDAPDPLPPTFDTRDVKFVDKQRRPGQRLASFEILGEVDREHARQFVVRMTFEPADGAPAPLVRYDVFGRDPVWVFRHEDYEMISHWEHDMTEEPAAGPDPPRGEARAGGADGPQTSWPP